MNEAFNFSERKDVRAAEKAAKIAEAARLEFVAGIMSLIPGRAWMCDLLEACHVFATSFTGQALSSAYNEGERNVGLRLLNDIMQACPDQYPLMMRERNQRDAARSSASQHRSRQNADGRDHRPEAGGDEAGDSLVERDQD